MSETRQAKSHELSDIFLMGYSQWSEGYSKKIYKKKCNSSKKYQFGEWWVLEKNHELVSSLIVYPYYHDLYGMASIATHENFRGKGFASELIRGVISQYKMSANTADWILYSEINPNFYKRLGFQILPEGLQPKSSIYPLMVHTDRLSVFLEKHHNRVFPQF